MDDVFGSLASRYPPAPPPFHTGPRPATTSAPAPIPPPKCVICYEEDVHLIRACRCCTASYCDDCLSDVFLASLDSPSLFPPKCCSLIQLYTTLPRLGADKAAQYRGKLEEWLCADKTYCPVPTCSAFISDRLIPSRKKAAVPTQMPVHQTISALLQKLDSTTFARFFRGDIVMDNLPRFREVVAKPMNLGDIKRKNDSRLYASVSCMANDLVLLCENAKRYNGGNHPVANAATSLFAVFIEDPTAVPAKGTSTKDTSTSPEPRDLFPCPRCHIAICTSCKQVEHTGKPCDKSDQDSYQLGLLQQFGYKQCPRCKQGVKKMFGCSHMQCICGAHWCWGCTKSLESCPGDCSDGDDEEDFADMDDGEDEDEDEDEEDEDSGVIEGLQSTGNTPAAGTLTREAIQEPQNAPATPTNLDAGGAPIWEGTGYFGDEPEDEPMNQIWSCHHHFVKFREPEDGFDHGNLDYLECNRCFKPLKAVSRRKDSAVRRRLKGTAPVKDDEQAWDCDYCRVIVCVDCKAKYQAGPVRP